MVADRDTVSIVGLGASAGGLQPMIDFFEAMPDTTDIAFVIVQHVDAGSRSQLPDIISRHTTMPVQMAEDEVTLEGGNVYVVRGHMHVSVEDDAISAAPVDRDGAFDVIDFFFRSLAESRHERAVGVILSGTGSDGAQGLREIRGAGGLSIAQDPDEAEYESMPAAAIRTGFVDVVLSVSEMPDAILGFIEHSSAAIQHIERRDGAQDGEATIESIINLLHREHQADFRSYKRSTITRRIQRRMGLRQVEGLREYHRHLQENPEEARQLAQDMLVGVTSFFRDREAFEDLRETVIAPIVESKEPDEAVRIWVPGAATGEEAYSIAILVHDVMNEMGRSLPVKVFASDLNPEAIERAREAIYPESIRADVPERYLDSYFRRPDEAYRVAEEVRKSVIFATHDILSDPPFSELDLISCRNVLIYLEPEAQKRIYGIFAFALREGGYLFLGRSDAASGAEEAFTRLDGEARIVRRTDASQATPDLGAGGPSNTFEVTRAHARARPEDDLARINRDVLLAHFAAAVALADENGEVLHFFGPTSRYLEHPTGTATLNIFDMAPDPLGTRLRSAQRRALESNERVRLNRMSLGDGPQELEADVTVVPINRPVREDTVIAFIFETPWKRPGPDTAEETVEVDDERRVAQLETDLQATRQDLEATIRELERANEDLVTANEEIMSMNEELQSANEELETSREELQSVNEELTTVNQELNEKLDQLRRTNADLENLLKAADIMAIFVSNELEIRRFSPAATRLLNLITTDIGRPLSDISHNLRDVELAAAVRRVVDTEERIEEEVRDGEGNWYIMRVHPYSAEHQVDGVVIAFVNITRVKETEQLAERRSETLRDLARQITEAEQAERHRVAGLIHDELQQMLAGAKMQVKTVESLADRDRASEPPGRRSASSMTR